MQGFLDTRALSSYERVCLDPCLPDDAAWTFGAFPGVLFVGLTIGKHPDVLARLIAQDRERLIQEQDQ